MAVRRSKADKEQSSPGKKYNGELNELFQSNKNGFDLNKGAKATAVEWEEECLLAERELNVCIFFYRKKKTTTL